MHPADRRQHPIVKALHTKTQSVEALPPQRGQRFGGNGSRIGFDADFGIIRQPKVTPDCLQNQCQCIRRQDSGRAAAKKQRIDAECGEIAARCGYFPAESGDIFLLRFFISNLRHKSAIATFCLAERDMNVNSPRRIRQPHHQSRLRTAMKASCGNSTLPTCFIRFLPSFCFSSSLRLRVISPP